MRTVILTRPLAQSQATAQRLRAEPWGAGLRIVIAPLLEIRPVSPPPAPDLTAVQALAFTSANGARAFAAAHALRDVPVFAVGGATARAAREAGFRRVESADGDGGALGALIAARLRPTDGLLLHAAGAHQAPAFAQSVRAAGFDLVAPVYFSAEAATHLGAAAGVLRDGEAAVVALYSPRSAEIFGNILISENLIPSHETRCVALSAAVAQAAARAGLESAVVAERPDEASMLAAIRRAAE